MKKFNKKDIERLENLKKLKDLLKYTNKTLIFTNLKPSKSGMSRTFKVYILKKNELYNITYLVASITDNTFTSDGKMKINGCGMDMLFETCYQVNCQARYLQGKKYNSDFAYNGIVKTRYNLI